MSRTFVIGSRGSKLAMWQAGWVKSRIEAAAAGGVEVRIEVIKTSGDALRDVPLTVIGGLGVFTKEIEQALLDGRVDIAVHSLKDLPTLTPDGLSLAAVTEREDARDALVLPAATSEGASASTDASPSINALPAKPVVGTSSPRRMAQLKYLRPDVIIKDLRGNVDTRLRKLDGGDYDAIILACAGLRRLGLAHRISASVPVREMLPAVGQGALGIETRSDDDETNRLAAVLNHTETRAACLAERALLRSLGGGCQLPIAAHAVVDGATLRVEGLVAEPSGSRVVRDFIEGHVDEAEALGERLAARLNERGARALIAAHSS